MTPRARPQATADQHAAGGLEYLADRPHPAGPLPHQMSAVRRRTRSAFTNPRSWRHSSPVSLLSLLYAAKSGQGRRSGPTPVSIRLSQSAPGCTNQPSASPKLQRNRSVGRVQAQVLPIHCWMRRSTPAWMDSHPKRREGGTVDLRTTVEPAPISDHHSNHRTR